MKYFSIIIMALFLTNAVYPAETSTPTGQTPNTETRVLRGTSPQDSVSTQPRNIREEKIYQESLEAIEKNKHKYMSPLPAETDNYEQYGLKKRFYFKFLFGFGYGILDSMTGGPRDTTYTGPYGATKSKLIYDFHFMAVFKPSTKRTGNDSVGYGFEVGMTHLTNMHNSPYHYWGIPVNLIFQIPLPKMSLQRSARNKDMLLTFGPGIFIPTNKNISARDVYMSFVIGLEENFVFGNGSFIMPVFVKIRFIFDRFKREGAEKFSHHLYWGIEAGVGITL